MISKNPEIEFWLKCSDVQITNKETKVIPKTTKIQQNNRFTVEWKVNITDCQERFQVREGKAINSSSEKSEKLTRPPTDTPGKVFT